MRRGESSPTGAGRRGVSWLRLKQSAVRLIRAVGLSGPFLGGTHRSAGSPGASTVILQPRLPGIQTQFARKTLVVCFLLFPPLPARRTKKTGAERARAPGLSLPIPAFTSLGSAFIISHSSLSTPSFALSRQALCLRNRHKCGLEFTFSFHSTPHSPTRTMNPGPRPT